MISTGLLLLLLFVNNSGSSDWLDVFQQPERIERKYGPFSEKLRLQLLEEAKKAFYFGYDNYMKYAYPLDELNPIFCRGRGPDYDNP